MRTGLVRHAGAAAILLGFLFIGLAYSLVVPPFEAPDEVYHYAFARRLAEGGSLPVQTVEMKGPWAHEGTQAPLYYFVVGRLTAGIDQSDFPRLAQRNPYANVGNPQYPGNKNMMLYSGRVRPLAGSNLALHAARWFSLALGLATLWLVYRIALIAFRGSQTWSLLTMATVAAIPQFAFVSTTASNDSLVITLATAIVYWLLRLVTEPLERPIPWWEWGVLGVLVGLAALSKLSGLAVLPLAMATVLWLAWKRRSWRLVVVSLAWIVVPAVAIAGWWYWRNYVLYGQWLGIDQLLSINGRRTRPRSWRNFVGEMRGLRYSFWGLFGWFSILLPDWMYQALDALSLVALAGLGVQLGRAIRNKIDWFSPLAAVWTTLVLAAASIIGLMLYWSTFGTSSQGRLLFPAIASLVTLMVCGLLGWLAFLPSRWRAPLLSALPLGLLACSTYCFAVLLPGSYYPSSPLATLPPTAHPVETVYVDKLEIVAVSVPAGRYALGDRVPVTLYLRARAPVADNVPLFVQFLNQQGSVMGNVTTYPGWGRRPTSQWQPGVLYEDTYLVRLEANASPYSPLEARVYAGFMDAASKNPLSGVTADGAPATGMIDTVQVAAAGSLTAEALDLQPADARFGERMRLAGYGVPESARLHDGHLKVTLLWEARQAPGTDFTAFVHVRGPDGQQAGTDVPPGEDRFPTRLWQANDRSLAHFDLQLENLRPGTYQVWAGLYPSASQGAERVPVAANNFTTRDNAILLGTVELK